MSQWSSTAADSLPEHSLRRILFELCSPDFLASAVQSAESEIRLEILCAAIRRNIVAGRASRFMRRWEMDDPRAFLVRYAALVAGFRATERQAWIDAQTPAHQDVLYSELLLIAAPISALLGRDWSDDLETRKHDLANEAFVALIGRQRAYRYTFDVPWHDWLRQYVSLCGRNLAQRGPSRRVNMIAIEDLHDESELALASVCACGRTTCDCAERHLELDERLSGFSKVNRELFRLWAGGYSVEDTAKRLNLSVAAVTNRRARIKKILRREGRGRPLFGD